MKIRRARPDEAPALTRLAFVSKAVWGYDATFMEACREELSVTAGQIADPRRCFCVAESTGKRALLGFYQLDRIDEATAELEKLFVDPEALGQGVGRQLMEHAADWARGQGLTCITVQSDPFAESFYRSVGAEKVGDKESLSIPGRLLPLLEIPLS